MAGVPPLWCALRYAVLSSVVDLGVSPRPVGNSLWHVVAETPCLMGCIGDDSVKLTCSSCQVYSAIKLSSTHPARVDGFIPLLVRLSGREFGGFMLRLVRKFGRESGESLTRRETSQGEKSAGRTRAKG
jgi:hypothetical protein